LVALACHRLVNDDENDAKHDDELHAEEEEIAASAIQEALSTARSFNHHRIGLSSY
jgi:hypothetical protein